MRFNGYRYDVTVYAYYKVAIAKTENEDEIYENAFTATKDIFKGWSEVKTIDNDVQEVDQSNKYFTIVDFSWELKVTVSAHDIDDAFGEAEGFVEDASLPNGVVFWEAEAIDGERDTEECWID